MLLVVLATGAQTIYFMRVYQVPPRFFFVFFLPPFQRLGARRRRTADDPASSRAWACPPTLRFRCGPSAFTVGMRAQKC